ncbi:MAG: hypothetical protein JXR07_04595 [Reichenbachiella sp.]
MKTIGIAFLKKCRHFGFLTLLVAMCFGATFTSCHIQSSENDITPWIKVDDFESDNPMKSWTHVDTENNTKPKIENPQVSEVRTEDAEQNNYLIKKPALEGVVGNRKAVSFKKLPVAVELGETYTFYIRIKVEYFPNNHVFGWGSLEPDGILENVYNGFEPSLRVTDRYDRQLEAKNDGTLMVRKDPWYDKIFNFQSNRIAKPMELNTWYSVWCVANNSIASVGGQKYDVYIQGGEEFPDQQKVYEGADFRMKREQPIIYFQATCNTGPAENPYGNGGVSFDDMYMAKGVTLTTPSRK